MTLIEAVLRAQRLLPQHLPEQVLIIAREVRADQRDMGLPHDRFQTVGGRVAAQHEQRGGAGGDRVTHALDEAVVDPEVGERPREGARRRAERRPGQGDEEDQAEQHAPEAAPEHSGTREAAECPRRGLAATSRPGDDRGVFEDDQALPGEPLEPRQDLVGPTRTLEDPDRQAAGLGGPVGAPGHR